MSQLTMRILIVHGVLAIVGACADPDVSHPGTNGESATDVEATRPGADYDRDAEGGWLTDGQIASAVRAASLAEVDEALAAEPKLVDPDVRRFAARIVTDHAAVADRIEVVAHARSLSLAWSDEEAPFHSSSAAAVAALHEAKVPVDRTYVGERVESLEVLLEVLTFALIPEADDPLLIEELEMTRDEAKEQLGLAEALRERLDQRGARGTGGEVAAAPVR